MQMSSLGESPDNNRFCDKCGAPLRADSLYCPRCGAAVSRSTPSQPSAATASPSSTSPPSDWREQRRQWRAQRREERYGRHGTGIGALVIAGILIVAGLAIFFPGLPWQVFWGSVLILLGLFVIYLFLLRNRRDARERIIQPEGGKAA